MAAAKHDFIVFILRGQPFHTGHLAVVKEALAFSGGYVIILVGSSREPRSLRNPFTFDERAKMIAEAFNKEDRARLLISPLLDYAYEDQTWAANVQSAVSGLLAIYSVRLGEKPTIGLIGHPKDGTSFYLRMFPQWESIFPGNYVAKLSATDLREEYFTLPPGDSEAVHRFVHRNKPSLPASTVEFLHTFIGTEAFKELHAEAAFVQRYKAEWAAAPYPPTFLTVDAVVITAGHVLLVERGQMPGKGKLALPGGFIGQDEKLRDAMLRELVEETGLRIPESVVKRAVGPVVFDNPHRSARGRTVTCAYRLHLQEQESGLPKVKGGDDAAKAMWVPLAALTPERMFDDHFAIIRVMTEEHN